MTPTWLRRLFKKRFAGNGKTSPVRRQLTLEPLEDRSVPAVAIWSGADVPDRIITNPDGSQTRLPGDLRWTNPLNWSTPIPTTNDDVIFPTIAAANKTSSFFGGANSLMNMQISISTFTIQDSGYDIRQGQGQASNRVLTITGAISYSTTGSSVTSFRTALTGNAQIFSITDAAGTLFFNGNIQNGVGATTVGLLKVGPGTLSLGGNNAYTGLVEVNTGTLIVTNDSALGTADVGTIVRDGATLSVNTQDLDESLEIVGTGVAGSALTGFGSIDGGITLNPSATIGGSLNIDGVITGAGNLTTTGTITLNNANTYLGATLVASGTLRITHNDALSPGSFTRVSSGASLQLVGNRVVDDEVLFLNGFAGGNTGALQAVNAGGPGGSTSLADWQSDIVVESTTSVGNLDVARLILSGPLTSPNGGSLTKVGQGTVTFPNPNLNFSGDVFITNGIVVMPGPDVLGPATAAGGPNPGGTVTVNFNLGTGIGGTLLVVGQYTSQKNLVINGTGYSGVNPNGTLPSLTGLGALRVYADPTAGAAPTAINWAGTLTIGGTPPGSSTSNIATDAGTSLTVSGILDGLALQNLQKNGAGSMTLTNTNTFLGALTLRDGVTTITNSLALGGAGGSGTTVASGATLVMTDSLTVTDESLTLSSTPGIPATLQATSGNNTWTGTVNLLGNGGGEADVSVIDPAAILNFTNVISGDAILRKLGAGELQLTGTQANTFVGNVQIDAGTLALGKTAGLNAVAGSINIGDGLGGNNVDILRLDAPNQIPDNRAVTVNSSGLFNLNNNDETIGAPPGTPTPPALTLSGGEVLNGTALLTINGNVATLGSTEISRINGNVSIGGATRTFSFRPTPASQISSNVNPSQFGNSVMFTFTATAQPGDPIPTGTVMFFDGLTQIGTTQSLSGGSASVSVNTLTAGSHQISAVYSGDGFYSSGTIVLSPNQTVVNPPQRAVLSTSANPATPGDLVEFTFNLAGNTGSPAATGTVMFFDGNPLLGNQIGTTQTLVNGVASVTTDTLALGTHTITAVYSGDPTYAASTATLSNLIVGNPLIVQLSTNLNPAPPNTPLVFSFRTSPLTGQPVATGNVTFFDGTTNLGTVALDGSGVATLNLAAGLALGTHTITAVYVGDNFYAPQTATLVPDQQISRTPVTFLTTSANPVVAGTGVTFTFRTNGDVGGPTPTGTVTFFDGATNLGTVNLTAGVATFAPAAGLTAGTHTISARYNGDTNYSVTTVNLDPLQSVTGNVALQLRSNANPIQAGSDVTFTFRAIGAAGQAVPTGTVTFQIDGMTLAGGPFTLVAGAFTTAPIAGLSVGSHTVSATYSGDATYAGGTVNLSPNQEVVNPLAVRLYSNSNPLPAGDTLTLTFDPTILAGGPTPTGTVTFLANGAILGGAPQTMDANGTATVSVSNLGAGTYTIVANYSGDSNYSSMSVTLPVSQIEGTPPVVEVSSDISPAPLGSTVEFSFRARGDAGDPTPTGTVTFFDGGTQLSPALTLSSGFASFSTSALTSGAHTITAVYSGDASYAPTTATMVPTLVVINPPLVQLLSNANPVAPGGNVTFRLNVNRATTNDPTPSGSVTFFEGATTLGTATLTGGTAAITIPITALNDPDIGTHRITAVFTSNDTNYQNVSVSFDQVVASPLPPLSPPPTTLPARGPDLEVNGVISGGAGAGISKTGPGRLFFNGVNTYSGPTSVAGAGGSIVLGVNNALPDTALSLNTGGALDVNGKTDAAASLSGTTGILALNGGSFTVGSDNSSTTFGGTITGNAASSLTKVGTGTLLLNGNSSTLAGTITVAGGTLGGSGTVGPVVVNPGTTIAPGTAAPGRFTTGNTNFSDGSTFFVRLNGTTAGGNYDQLASTGTVALNNATLNLSLGFSPAQGQAFSIITATSVTGTFRDTLGNVLADGATFVVNNRLYQIDYSAAGVTVNFLGVSAVGTLTSSVNPSLPGQSVSFTASYTSALGTPTGMVSFYDGVISPANLLATVALNGSGSATTAGITTLALGTHNIIAVLTSTTFASPNLTLSQAVNYVSATALTTSGTPTVFPNPVTFTATVSGSMGTPTGTVTFTNATTGAVLGSAPLNGSGVAQLSTAAIPPGSFTIRATYNGDFNYRSSIADVAQVVNRKPLIAVGSAPGAPAVVSVHDGLTGAQVFSVNPLGAYLGGVKTAVGDVNNDGFNDVIIMMGQGSFNGLIGIFNGQNFSLMGLFFAFPGYAGELNIAAGDVTGDGASDIIIGTATNFDAVLVYDGVSQSLTSVFSAFAPFFGNFGFTGGITVGTGDVNGDGRDDVIVGSRSGAGLITVNDGMSGAVMANFLLPPSTVTGGLYVAGGDLNGDGKSEIIGSFAANSPVVFTFDGATQVLSAVFTAFGGAPTGAQVSTVDSDGDGKAEIAVAATSIAPFVQIFSGLTFTPVYSVFAVIPGIAPAPGAYVGGSL